MNPPASYLTKAIFALPCSKHEMSSTHRSAADDIIYPNCMSCARLLSVDNNSRDPYTCSELKCLSHCKIILRSVEAHHPDCDALQCFLHFFASLVTRLGLCGLRDATVGNFHSILFAAFLHLPRASAI